MTREIVKRETANVKRLTNVEINNYLAAPKNFCLLPFAFCLLPFAFCLLPFAYCLLPIAFCLLPPPSLGLRRARIAD
jgi:hypothetical protein